MSNDEADALAAARYILDGARTKTPLVDVAQRAAEKFLHKAHKHHKPEKEPEKQAAAGVQHMSLRGIADLLDAKTSREWRGWLPETIWSTLHWGPSTPRAAKDRVMAVLTGLTNPDVWEHWALLVHVNSAFNGRAANFEWLDRPSAVELAWTLEALRGFRPGTLTGHAERMVRCVAQEDGFAYYPWLPEPVITDTPEIPEIRQAWTRIAEGHLTVESALSQLEEADAHSKDPMLAQTARLFGARAYVCFMQDFAFPAPTTDPAPEPEARDTAESEAGPEAAEAADEPTLHPVAAPRTPTEI